VLHLIHSFLGHVLDVELRQLFPASFDHLSFNFVTNLLLFQPLDGSVLLHPSLLCSGRSPVSPRVPFSVHLLQFLLESGYVLRPGSGVDALFSDNLAVEYFEDPMGEVFEIDIVGDHHQGYFLGLVQSQQNVEHDMCIPCIQISSGFVQQ